MKALVLENYNRLIFREVPDPEPGPKDVLIRVKSCGICGSDVHGLDGSTARRIPPIIMGHEAAGIIEKVGSDVKNWKSGDRVTFDSTIYSENDWFTQNGMYNLSDDREVLGVSCQEFKRDGAFAEYVKVPQHILYKIPENVTFNQAAMVEPAAVALHAVNLTPLKENHTVLILGAGMIGLFVLQALKTRGVKEVLIADIEESRLKMAGKLGADLCINPDKEDLEEQVNIKTDKRGTDAVLEAVGLQQTIDMGIQSVRKGGTVTLIGNVTPEITFPLQDIVTRQLRIQGSYAICGEYPEVLALLSQKKIRVEPLLSSTAPLSEGAQWFKRLKNKEAGLIKVVLNP